MIRKRPIYRGLIAALCLGLLTGCWDSTEIDDLAMVMGSGLDMAKDGQLEGTVQIASPMGIPTGNAGGNKKPVLVMTEKGLDVVDIINRMQKKLSRRFFLGHRGVLVIGESYARHGVDQVLDELIRSPDARYSCYILTSRGTKAKEIIGMPYSLENIPAFAIKKIQQESNTLGVKLGEFLDAMSVKDGTVVTGAIRIANAGAEGKMFSIDGAAVYKNNRLAGFLDQDETKMLLWKKGKIKGSMITTQVQPKNKMFKGTVGLRFLNTRARISTQIKDGMPHATITYKARVKVLENDTKLDLSKDKNLKLIENKFAEHTRKLLNKTLHHAQREYKADVFGIGEEIHMEHPYYWKKNKERWKDIFPGVQVTYKVEYTISRTGRTQAPAHLQK